MSIKNKIIQSINITKCLSINNELKCIDFKIQVGDYILLQVYNNLNFGNFFFQDIEGICIYIKQKGFLNTVVLRNTVKKYEVKVFLFSKYLYTVKIIESKYKQKFVRIFNKCKLYLLKY